MVEGYRIGTNILTSIISGLAVVGGICELYSSDYFSLIEPSTRDLGTLWATVGSAMLFTTSMSGAFPERDSRSARNLEEIT